MSPEGDSVPVDPSTVVTVKRKTPQSSRSWISIDSTGQRTVLDEDKYAIMHRVQIHARDLRILDPNLSYPSAILGRERAIVLNLEHIKAIITAQEVLVRDSSDENLIPVLEEFQRRFPVVQEDAEAGEEDESPFEFRALEVALEAICSLLAARTTELETCAYPALDELTLKISSRNLERVRKLKSAMTRLTARVQKVKDELEKLLDDDDDMADIYLTRKLAGVSSSISVSDEPLWYSASPKIGSKISPASRMSLVSVRGDDENDVEELEMLLEAYFMQIDFTLNKLTTLREYIDNTEDYINIQLDNYRNKLIQVFRVREILMDKPSITYCCVKGKTKFDIFFKRDKSRSVIGYSDSSYNIDVDDGRSTSGHAFYYSSPLITWMSQKQSTVALSSCDAEFMVATEATKQVI